MQMNHHKGAAKGKGGKMKSPATSTGKVDRKSEDNAQQQAPLMQATATGEFVPRNRSTPPSGPLHTTLENEPTQQHRQHPFFLNLRGHNTSEVSPSSPDDMLSATLLNTRSLHQPSIHTLHPPSLTNAPTTSPWARPPLGSPLPATGLYGPPSSMDNDSLAMAVAAMQYQNAVDRSALEAVLQERSALTSAVSSLPGGYQILQRLALLEESRHANSLNLPESIDASLRASSYHPSLGMLPPLLLEHALAARGGEPPGDTAGGSTTTVSGATAASSGDCGATTSGLSSLLGSAYLGGVAQTRQQILAMLPHEQQRHQLHTAHHQHSAISPVGSGGAVGRTVSKSTDADNISSTAQGTHSAPPALHTVPMLGTLLPTPTPIEENDSASGGRSSAQRGRGRGRQLLLQGKDVHSSSPPMLHQKTTKTNGASGGNHASAQALYVEEDDEFLTDYQCLLRKQLEIFEASKDDLRGSTQGRNTPILLGQVGLRCRHCANLPLAARTKGAVYYSQTIEGVYQIAQNMSKVHLCQRCYRIPGDIQRELIVLKNDAKRAAGGKEYWTKALQNMGVYEDGKVLRMRVNKKANDQ
eukprot:Nitzschia sp. Nitz4//scaffold118_size93875//25117//27034//NITZ4_004781-RA/size93875-augustus-gene-0.83-mRNA-1//1//CDS//3329533703//2168//frame0